MTSKTFIKAVSESTGKTQKEIKEIFDAGEVVLKGAVKDLTVGDKVKVLDVSYSVKDVAAREGRNPATGESISIPATKAVKTKLSGDFKAVVK